MYNDLTTENAVSTQAGFDLATAQQKPVTLEENGIPFIVNALGQAQSLEKLLLSPVSTRGAIALDDTASFAAYVNRFKTAASLVFAKCDLTGGKFTAILDYHLPDKAARGAHVASLALVATVDWLAWTRINGHWHTQQAFCEFVEKYRHVFSEPSAADMLEISRSIEAKTEGNFKAGTRLKNGDRTLIFETTTTAKAGTNGTLEIPEEIKIILIPFEGADPASVSAFLRFRIEGGAVKFQVELQRPEEIIRASVSSARANIESATGLPVFAGTANLGQ